MGIAFAVILMLKTPSLFVPLMPVATVWIHSGRRLAVTTQVRRGVLRLLLQRLQLLLTPRVVVLAPLVLRRSSTSSLFSRGASIGEAPCRTGGGRLRLVGLSFYFVCDDARQVVC